MASRSLVLNRNWVPITMTSVRRAVTLVYKGLARVVSPSTYETFTFDSWIRVDASEDEACIRTVSLRIRVPEAILLASYDAIPHSHIPFTRKNLYRRDRFTCQYCGKRPQVRELTIDHIVPRSKGGRSTWTNCVVACMTCNTRKSDRTPSQVGLTLHSRPHKPKWQPHITIPAGKETWEKFIPEKRRGES